MTLLLRLVSTVLWPSLVLVSIGCSNVAGGSGTVQIFVEAEDTIANGLEPGSDAENIRDGWKVTFDKWILTLGNFRASQSADPSKKLEDQNAYVVDIKQVPAAGLILSTFSDVEAVRWDKFGYDFMNANANAKRAGDTAEDDYALFVQDGLTLRVKGYIEKAGGKSCNPKMTTSCVDVSRIDFDWKLKAPVRYDECKNPNGDGGFAVPSGGTAAVKPTIHGDHWFFSSLGLGTESTIRRCAQWIADMDLNRNGETTVDELKDATIRPGTDILVECAGIDYSLAAGNLGMISTAYDFALAQARTSGHLQGEGECETRTPLN